MDFFDPSLICINAHPCICGHLDRRRDPGETDTFLYETTPTLNSDVVVYTAREMLNNGFFDQGDIWYQDLNDLTVEPVQITSDITDDKLNDVSGDYIVYTSYDTTMGSTGTIMLYRISIGVLGVTQRGQT